VSFTLFSLYVGGAERDILEMTMSACLR